MFAETSLLAKFALLVGDADGSRWQEVLHRRESLDLPCDRLDCRGLDHRQKIVHLLSVARYLLYSCVGAANYVCRNMLAGQV